MDATGFGSGRTPGLMRDCARCGVKYDWSRSGSSWLKMTYCSVLCERAGLGFTLDAMLVGTRHREREVPVAA